MKGPWLIFSALLALLIAVGSLDPAGHEVRASRLAGIGGRGATTVQLVNLDPSRPASGSLALRRHADGQATAISFAGLLPETSRQFYLPDVSELAAGRYAGQVSADRPVGSLYGTSWPTGGYSADGAAAPSTDVLVPLALKGRDGATSLLTVQNPSVDRSAAVEIAYYEMAASMPARRMQFQLPPGASRTIDPNREPDLRLLPTGYVGSARVKAPVPVAVQALVDIAPSARAVYAFAGMPVEAAATEVFVPVVHATTPWPGPGGAGEQRDTLMAVLNPGVSPVVVALSYRGHAGSCAGQTYNANPVTIPGGRNVIYFQGAAGEGQPTGRSPLPDGCAASAMLSAAYGRIAVTVVETVRDALGRVVRAAAYNGFRADDASSRLYGVLRTGHTDRRFTTGLWVMNTSSRTAEARAVFRLVDRPVVEGCPACQVRIPPRGAHLWWPPDIPELVDGGWGSVIVSADQPLVAVVADLPLAPGPAESGYDHAILPFLPLGQGAGSAAASLPLLLRDDELLPATPTAPPTPTGTPPPPADAIWSTVLVQNLDRTAAARWTARLSAYGSGAVLGLEEGELPAGGRLALSLWQRSDLPDADYRAVLTGDRPLAAVSDLRWPASGRAVAHGWPAPGTEVVVPLVAKRYNDQVSLVAVQNTDAGQAALVRLELHSFRQREPLATTTLALDPGDGRIFDLATEPAFRGVPNGTIGYLSLRSERPLAAEALLLNSREPRLAASISGVPVERLADRLYVPFFRREYLGGTTLITVVNPGESAIEVGVTYFGSAGDCAGRRYAGRAMTVPAGGSVEMSQAASANHNLPANCAGSAVLTSSSGPFTAVVTDAVTQPSWGGGSVAAYNALPALDAGLALAVPVFRKSAAAGGTMSGIQVMNVGETTCRVRLAFYDVAGAPIEGCGEACQTALRPSESHLWWLGDLPILEPERDAHAWLESDGPIAAVVFDQPTGVAAAAVDDGTAYTAPAAPQDTSAGVALYGPYLPNPVGAAPPATATSTATPPHTPTAPPTAAPSGAAGRLWLPWVERGG